MMKYHFYFQYHDLNQCIQIFNKLDINGDINVIPIVPRIMMMRNRM